jgi:hypothetical protein
MRFQGPMAFALMVGAAACTTTADEESVAMGALSGSFGVVQIDRGTHPDLAELTSQRAVLNAVFARYAGLEGEEALELLGLGRSGPAWGECALRGSPPVLRPGVDAAVELLDVGRLEVRVAGSRAELRARTFPELGTLVAGAFYAEDAQLAETRADVDEYHLLASGTAAIERFEAVLVGPPAPAEVTVDGQPLVERPAVVRTGGLELLWDAGDPRDRIEVQLVAGGLVLECVARDHGHLAVDADAVAQLDADDDARLTLRRVRAQPFDAPGLDVAWADVTATATFPLRLE